MSEFTWEDQIDEDTAAGFKEMTEPNFTDEQLQQLKQSEHRTVRFQIDKEHDEWVSLAAILTRLEAAELVCNSVPKEAVTEHHETFRGLISAWEAWREACGK